MATVADKLERQRFRLAIGQAMRVRFVMQDPPDDVDVWSMRFRIRRGNATPLVDLASGDGIEPIPVDELEEETAGWDVTLHRDDTLAAAKGEAEWSLWNIAAGSENPNAIGTVTLFLTADGIA